MIHITNKENCCGCNACGDICPKDSISFKVDKEGFWYPEVNLETCVDCHLCEKVCPMIQVERLKKNDLPQSVCYAVENKNLEVLFDSTSGGAFSALADIMYKDKGFVGGAVFNDDFSVRHFISDSKKDLPRLRSSKYLQSSLIGFYNQVKELLDNNKHVLVCGCPCQMVALRAYLKKDYENLIIADFVCLGINSPKVWHKYLESFEERYGSKVVYCKAKSKEYGWRNLTQKVILANGKHLYETKNQSNYTKGFIQTYVYCRPSCYKCKFKGYPRIADITLADFWGVNHAGIGKDKNLGTSLVMVNSQKGERYFERVKSRIRCAQVPFNIISKGNFPLEKPIPAPLVDRNQFFEDLNSMNFSQLAEKYIRNQNSGLRFKIKRTIGLVLTLVRNTRLCPASLYRFFRLNTLREIWNGNMLITTPYCIVKMKKGAKIQKKGVLILGYKGIFGSSKNETHLFLGKDATLSFEGNVTIGYGADIEIFDGASVNFKGNNTVNIGLTLICGDRIEFGKDTMIGRNVIIRDNNGSHYINRQSYKNASPVIVGDKVWLCESCTVMKGVKIGDGAIVDSKSFVIRDVKAHTMISGHPASVVDEDVYWKY